MRSLVSRGRILRKALAATMLAAVAAPALGPAVASGAPDTLPPVTTFSASPSAVATGPVTVSLSAVDALTPNPIIRYRVVDPGAQDTGVFAIYEGPFTITKEGKTGIIYSSVDRSPNENAEPHKTRYVVLDSTGPKVTVDFSKLNGRFIADDRVSVRATDTVTGLASLIARVDDRQDVNAGRSGLVTFASLSAGTHTVTYVATDQVGNVSRGRVSFYVKHEQRFSPPHRAIVSLKRRSGKATTSFYATLSKQGGATLGGRLVYLQKSRDGKTWARVKTLRTRYDGTVVSPKITFRKAGTTFWRWYAPADKTYRKGYSAKATVKVR